MKINDLESLRIRIEMLEGKSKLEREKLDLEFVYLKVQIIEEALNSLKNLFSKKED